MGKLPDTIELEPSVVIRTWVECEEPVKLWQGVRLLDCRIGAYSYVSPNSSLVAVTVGRYCSIGHQTELGASIHPTDRLSSSAVFYQRVFKGQHWPVENDTPPLQTVTLGHDVWIGAHAKILPGVAVGTGAVVAMGAVVAKDVPAYAVVAGNPATVKKMRFPVNVCGALLDSNWWEFDWPRCPEAASLSWNDPMRAVLAMRDIVVAGKVARLSNRHYRIIP